MFRNRLSILCLASSLAGIAGLVRAEQPGLMAAVPVADVYPSWYASMTYTTAFFGPNALPVPELYDGKVDSRHSAEVSTDVFWGFGDQTQSLSTRITYAAIPDRLALHGWGVLLEHSLVTPEVKSARYSQEPIEQTVIIGDLYLSTEVALLKESRYRPDLNLEIVLKTASTKSPSGARFFDTPGYWFDLTGGKSFRLRYSFTDEIRLVGMLGFLCYQTNSRYQDDAFMYGGKVQVRSGQWMLESGLQGYEGWIGGDKPLVWRSGLNFQGGSVGYFVQYQHAFRDYPFRRLQTGVRFAF